GYQCKVLECDAGVDPAFIKIAGEAIAEQVSFITQPVTSQFPAAKAFIDAYKSKFGEEPGALSAYTYDAMTVAIAALKETNGTDPDKLITALKKYKADGLNGKIEFDEQRQLVGEVFVTIIVKNAEIVLP